MKHSRTDYGFLLHQIAAAHECTELAAFDLERGVDQMRPLYHVTGLDADQPERKQAAIEAFKNIITRHCLPTESDATILVDSSTKQFCLVTLARRLGKVVGAAAFIKEFADEVTADAALDQIREEAELFRNGPMPAQGYRTVRGSDVQRDGMYLRLIHESTGDEVAEVLYSDTTHKMTISVFQAELPLEVVELLIERARHELPPRAP